MSQHSSLRASSKTKRHRSVFKRYERIKILKKEGRLKDEDSIFGLPKVKSIKIKIKKEKVDKEAATPQVQQTQAPEAQKDTHKKENPKK